MYFEEFGSVDHLDACYVLASNEFIGLYHYNDDDEPLNDERVNKFKNFIMSLHLQQTVSLYSYLEEGGDIMDHYEYFQYGNGDYNVITIPELIICSGSVKLMREMISIEPEYVNLVVNIYPLLSHSISYGKYEITDLLLLHGANPNIQGKRGKTSLYQAINKQNPEIVKKLLDSGADPNMKYALSMCNYLYTALYNYDYMRRTTSVEDEDSKKIVKMLIKHGVECQNKLYSTTTQNVYDEIIAEMNENGEY